MKYACKATARLISILLVAILMTTVFPTSAFATIDEPLSGVTGSGWDDFGNLPEDEFDPPPITEEPPGDDALDSGSPDNEDVSSDGGVLGAEDGKTLEEMPKNAVAPLTLGVSGEWTLPDDTGAEFIEFLESVEKEMHKPTSRAAPGDMGTVSWAWGEQVEFTTSAGHYIGNIPRLTLSTANPAQDIPFCAKFGVDPDTSSPYTAKVGSNQQILKLLIAHKEGKASTVGVQLAIWSITNHTSFRSHPEAQAAWYTSQNVDTDGYSYLEWRAGSGQPFYTLERFDAPSERELKIIKKSTSGRLLSGAKFSVSGPGVNETGLVTNSRGEILVKIPSPGGIYTVTETTPPSGYLPAGPDSQTVTIDANNPSGTVIFENEPEGDGPPPEGEESSFRVEVETEVETKVDVRNEKEIEYSRAYGQLTVRKHDQDGNSLDGALFNIEVRFTDGTVLRENNWEVDNGARLFTYTHPENNHDPATATITEVQPPRYYTGDPTPKTVTIQPSYTRTIISTTWTETVWTYFYRYTVIEISLDGDETEVDSWTESRDEFEVTPGNVENFPEYVDGDREITTTFVNHRITGDVIVTKKDANTGLPLAGASVHLWGTDLGEPSTINKTLLTGPDGTAIFDNLPPGTYAIQETQPPFGYNLNDEIQNAVLQSGQTLHKEIRNYRKDGLIIKKTDQNGVPLPGAMFELRRGSGEVLLSDVTNKNGIIYRGHLTQDLYVIEEIQAPEGYLLDENPIKEIYIYATDDNKEYTVSFVNKKRPGIEITKVDGDTPTRMLSGAVFRITDTQTNQYWDVRTGEDGMALLDNLDLGTTYIVEELEAPHGYVNSGYRQEIVLKECRKHTITVANRHMPKMTIIKKDIGTGELLPGATFRISWNNGTNYRDVTTGENGEAKIPSLPPGWYTVTETKAPNGYLLNPTPQQVHIIDGQDKVIEIFNEKKPSLSIKKVDSVTKTPLQYAKFRIEKKTDGGAALIGEYISDADGIVHLENIVPGRYLITEITAPDGYNIDTVTHEVTIEFGQVYKIELTNTAKSPIYIQKVDETGNPLAGAKFKVATMNGAMVGTVTTGRTGCAIIPCAEPGWYVVEEVQAPDGYVLSNTPVNIEVKSGKPAQVEFVNYQKPMLQILKLDADSQKALPGAKFKVTQADGALVGEYTTGKDGLISIEGLAPGAYIISEIRSPDGYILDMTPKTVTLEAGKTLCIEFTNTAKPGLQLLKLDKISGKPIKGVVFQVVQLLSGAKKDLGTFTTGENGTFYIPDLAPGDYIITEVKAAGGYIADSTPKNIHVEGGKLNTVEFTNIPYSNLRLLKIDAETRAPLADATFKLFDEKRLEAGTYTTTALGEINVAKLPSGNYFIQEVKAPAGYLLDNTVRPIELIPGKTTTVEWKNTPLGSLRIVKIDKETKKPLYGAKFLLYDSRNNLLGEFSTDQNGLITFGRNLQAGKYKLKEIKAPDGYILDETVRTITVKQDETTEIVIENEPKRGQIQITKVAASRNSITKDKEGTALGGAVFEVYNNKMELVDTMATDPANGMATSKPLPLGVYGIKEKTSPKYYFTDGKIFYAEVKVNGDLVKFRVKNKPVDLETTVEKRGVVEAMAGSSILYTLSGIENKSNVPLEEFYLHDVLPAEAVRLEKVWTGVWSDRVRMDFQIRTNLKDRYRTIKKNLLSTTNNEIDCSRAALGLSANEYVTEFRLVFHDEVEPGFRDKTSPKLQVRVLDSVKNGRKFVNKADVGGKYGREWVYDTDGWTTVTYNKPKGDLPKTGG